MQIGAILTFGSYVALVTLWGSILALYWRRLPETRQRDPLVAALLVVLLVDAAKNVLESVYFGSLWGTRFGFLPEWVGAPLEDPLAMAIPKVVNVGVAVFVLVRIVGGFFPRELKERQRQRDESARLQQETEHSLALVQESEGRLQSLLERTSDVVAFWRVVDEDVVLESVNTAGKQILGFGDEAVGTSWRELAPPSLQTLLENTLETALPQREEDGWLETESGRRAVIRQVVPLPDEDGVVRRIASFTQDITALRERQAEEDAHTRLESLGILAGGVAHDFNNLLAILRADIDQAVDVSHDADATRESLDHAVITIDRARDLVTQLLGMTGKRAPVTGAVDFGAVVVDTARLLMPSAPAGVKLETAVAPGAIVIGDRTQLQRVVLNLLHNGLDAAASGGGTRVRVNLSATDADVVMTVEDDGAGIDPAVQGRIFEPFFTTKRGGRGLGLATVFGLTRGHGGSVEVTSAPGAGATFTVRLPRAVGVELSPESLPLPRADVVLPPSDRLETPAATETSEVDTTSPALPSSRASSEEAPRRPAEGLMVLLIDDDDRVRRATKRLLERLGHQVIDVEGGAAGLAIDAPYDIALVDVTMPDMDGPTALIRLREQRPGLPAVLVTGRADIAGDVDIVLTKPFDAEGLQQALQQGLDQTGSRDRRRRLADAQ